MAMNRKDYVPFLVILVLLLGWPHLDRIIKKKFFPTSAHPVPVATAKPSTSGTSPAGEPPALTAAPADTPAATPAPEAAAAVPAESATPEQTATLSNGRLQLILTSRGAALQEAMLSEYTTTRDPASGPVTLDFRARTALAYRDLPGLSDDADFQVQVSADGHTATFVRALPSGLRLTRTVHVGDRYEVDVADEFVNQGSQKVDLPAHSQRTGSMRREAGHVDRSGISTLGMDTLSPGGEGVKHWGTTLSRIFKAEQDEKALAALPEVIDRPPREKPVDWVAAKNKYFVQILHPEEGADNSLVYARRSTTAPQAKMTPVDEVGAAVVYAAQSLDPGATYTRKIQYYVGPKKYSELFAMRLHEVDVMEFGFWAPVGKVLLVILNFIHDHLWPHNYGLAIILLTIIVRVLFWPLTHKSTENMRRMAALQPLMQQINEKYKNDAQKRQQALMELYKEHKINPLNGCLPMLVQIPVFIALFVVLRSAIELRYSGFLWIRDLSEPEHLFAGVLPIPLNILPILMSITMFWQQKLTPAAGDPAQQRMMRVMMPIMMLFFLYNFASGLALYWTTQNAIMIIQQLVNLRRKKAQAAAGR